MTQFKLSTLLAIHQLAIHNYCYYYYNLARSWRSATLE